MIEVPKRKKSRTATRVIAEALAQATPVTAGLARLYQFTHPSEFEQQLEQWRWDVSKAVNEISEQLRPRLVISEVSLETAKAVVEKLASKGYGDSITFDRIVDALPDFDCDTIQQACFDLRDLGFLSIEGAVGKPILNVRPDGLLFQTFDPYFRGTNPAADAVEIARTLIDQRAVRQSW